MSDPAIRTARPEDAAFLAAAMLAAARAHLDRGWYDIALAAPESRCLEYLRVLATTEALSWWHHSHFLIAEVDGNPAATLGAFRAGDAYALSAPAMAQAAAGLRLSETEQAEIWQRGSYLFLCTLGDDEAWTLENIYTAPEWRGRGLAGRLIEHAVREGGDRGFAEAQITSFIGNQVAERCYRKAGFELTEEKRHADFEAAAGAPGLQRFVRRLNA